MVRKSGDIGKERALYIYVLSPFETRFNVLYLL